MNGNLDLILAILLGRKVKDDAGLWHVYDADGSEIGDPGGVLLRGNLGALLTWPNPVIEEIVQQAGGGGRRRPFSDASEDDLIRLVHEKWAAVEAARALRRAAAMPAPAGQIPQGPRPPAPQDDADLIRVPDFPALTLGAPLPSAHAATVEDTATLAAQREAQARRRQDDEAMLLILAHLS